MPRTEQAKLAMCQHGSGVITLEKFILSDFPLSYSQRKYNKVIIIFNQPYTKLTIKKAKVFILLLF